MTYKIIPTKDANDLIPTNTFKYAHFGFEHFNPVQSRVIEAHDKDCNYVVAAQTSVGKTICSELFLSHEIREKKKKGVFLAPFRALSQERIDDWQKSSHHFKDLKIAICTGDYKLTLSRKKELEEANLIVMTTELFNCKIRNYKSERNEWLKDIGTVVSDEFHLISSGGTSGRGSHIESGFMQFTKINPESRLILLSATVPNAKQVGEWISSLNKKPTYVLESEYRPCPLVVHYVKYEERFSYDENEKAKVGTAIDVLERHPKDKFIIFAHTKRTQELLYTTLKKRGILCEYHNADLTKEKRTKVENDFKENCNLRCIIATSTLAAGINMPARRTIICGVHRGLTEVDVFDCKQMCGRAGRPQYDTQGDAYILLPEKKFDHHKERLETPQDVVSQMLDKKCLAFHLTSEIHHGTIRDIEDVKSWYKRTLAWWQNQDLEDDVIEEVIKSLTKSGVVINNDGLEITKVGMVSSMFYYSPFDVSDLYRNWNKLFEKSNLDDVNVAMALGNTDTSRVGIVSNADKDEMTKFRYKVRQDCAGEFTEGAIKSGCCYYNLLNGINSPPFTALMRNIQGDSERLIEVLCMLDQVAGRWGQNEYFRRLYLRLTYGVSEELVDLCRIKNIGKVKAKRLFDADLCDLESIAMSPVKVIKALKCSKKIAEDISENAKEILRRQL